MTLAVARVRDRVQQGGHDIPLDTIQRRYQTGLRNFFALYQPLADLWHFYDNSDRSGPRLLAAGKTTQDETVRDPQTWSEIVKRWDHEPTEPQPD